MYYQFHIFHRLRKTFSFSFTRSHAQVLRIMKDRLWTVYLELYMEVSLKCVQRIQNLPAGIMCNNFNHIHSLDIEMVRSSNIQTVRKRRHYFLCVSMLNAFMALHRIISVMAPQRTLTYMRMIQEVLKIGIHHGAIWKSVKEVFLIRTVNLVIGYHRGLKTLELRHNYRLLNG